MKKIYLLALVSILLTACNSETPTYSAYDEETKAIAESHGLEEFAFSLILNREEPWVPNEMRVAVIESETHNDLQIVARHVYGKSNDFDFLTMTVRGFKGVGTYKISAADHKMAWYMSLGNKVYVNNEGATLEITDYDKEERIISGRFSGEIYSPKTKTANSLVLDIGNGVINNLQIEYSEDIISNAKKPKN